MRTCIVNCSAICALALTVPEFARAQDCYVRIYGYNDDYLEATVDTRSMESSLFLENVSFEVTLRIEGWTNTPLLTSQTTTIVPCGLGGFISVMSLPSCQVFHYRLKLAREVANTAECRRGRNQIPSWAGRTIVNASLYVRTIRPLLEECSEKCRPDLGSESGRC